jgi:geranyl-CoA carboxylase alpha subunit
MQAKLIAHGPTRDLARRKLIKMLNETVLLGVTSNRDFLARIIDHEAFAGGDFSTAFIARHFPPESVKAMERPGLRHKALAAAVMYQTDAVSLQTGAGLHGGLTSWYSSNPTAAPVKLRCHGEAIDSYVLARPNGEFEVRLAHEGQEHVRLLTLTALAGHELHYVCDGVQGRAYYARRGAEVWLCSEGETHAYADATFEAARNGDDGGDGRLLAPMDGKIVQVNAKSGQDVRKGETLVVLEAMKMEFQVTAGVDGTVEAVNCTVGSQVKARSVLVAISPATA